MKEGASLSTYIPVMLPFILLLLIALGALVGNAGIRSLRESEQAARESVNIPADPSAEKRH